MKQTWINLIAALLLLPSLCAASCSKPESNFVTPAPPASGNTDNGSGSGSGGGNDGGSDNGTGTGTTEDDGTHCTDIGQTPIVLAYYTEYGETLPDVTKLTHINYAHGRFKNPSTGDGGSVIANPEKLEAIVALKSQNPKLKVMLMIGGWGGHADGFSMMARSEAKRTAF